MGEATKAQACRKLETLRPKVGYPSKWLDYSTVTIVPDALVANAVAMRRYNRADQSRGFGQKTDLEEWGMTPQTVNAHCNSTFNEIVFPAGILQPPFFDVNADPAVNYGAVGAVIGHEMGHGFDDQGSKSDFAGIQLNWWADADRAAFDQRTKALGAQYAAYCPLPVAADPDQDQPALAGDVPRQRPAAEFRSVVPSLRGQAGRCDVPATGAAGSHLVTRLPGLAR